MKPEEFCKKIGGIMTRTINGENVCRASKSIDTVKNIVRYMCLVDEPINVMIGRRVITISKTGLSIRWISLPSCRININELITLLKELGMDSILPSYVDDNDEWGNEWDEEEF